MSKRPVIQYEFPEALYHQLHIVGLLARGNMQHDKNCRGQSAGQGGHKRLQRFDAACGRADNNDVTLSHKMFPLMNRSSGECFKDICYFY